MRMEYLSISLIEYLDSEILLCGSCVYVCVWERKGGKKELY